MLPPSIRRTLLTAFAVAAGAGHACAQGTPPTTPAAQDTAKALNDINNNITALGDKLNRITAEITGLRDDVNAVKQRSLTNESELRRLNEEIAALKKRLDDMAKPATSSSGKVTQTAKVKFSNRYTADMVVNLNGTTYTVAPSEEREIPVAAGAVVYQVHGYQTAAKYNTLSDNQMLTVTLRPAY